MTRELELLTRAYEALDRFAIYDDLRDEIEVFLAAEPEANEHSISGAIAFTNGYYGGRCTVLPSNPAMVIPAGIPLYTRPGPEAEPVAWPIDGEIAHRIAEKQCVSYEVVQLIAREILRLHPPRPEPARKPMTEEEMIKGSGEWAHLHNIFEEGIRFAEKHHFGIGGDDE